MMQRTIFLRVRCMYRDLNLYPIDSSFLRSNVWLSLRNLQTLKHGACISIWCICWSGWKLAQQIEGVQDTCSSALRKSFHVYFCAFPFFFFFRFCCGQSNSNNTCICFTNNNQLLKHLSFYNRWKLTLFTQICLYGVGKQFKHAGQASSLDLFKEGLIYQEFCRFFKN